MRTNLHSNLFLRIIFFLPIIFSISNANAINAYPYPIVVQQPDGSTLTIRLHGDEYFHYTTLENGSVIAQEADGYYYHASYDASGQLNISDQRADAASIFSLSTRGISKSTLQTASIRSQQQRAERMHMLNPSSTTGRKKSLIILVEFQDRSFKSTSAHTDFSKMLNEPNYSENGGTGSVRDYYLDNSNNVFDPDFIVIGPLKLSQNVEYYGGNDADKNDKKPREMILESCKLAKESGVNFKDFDTDGNGIVDNIFVYYAGVNEAEGGAANTIWPHSWSVYNMPGSNIDGVSLGYYACSSELKGNRLDGPMAGIGTFCHEFAHVLGLPDTYDTDYESNGKAPGLYELSLMCSGNYNNEGRTPPYLNGYERQMLDWLTLTEITTPGEIILKPISENVAYAMGTPNGGEFFVFENRIKKGWDAYINGSGMVIYHIDQSNNMVSGESAKKRWSTNTINAIADHQCFDLVEASGYEVGNSTENSFFPGGLNNTSFTKKSTPRAETWGGVPIGLNIENIRQQGENILFDVKAYEKSSLSGVVTYDDKKPMADAKVTLVLRKNDDPLIGETPSDGEFVSATTGENGSFTLPPVEEGTYVLKIEKSGYNPFIHLCEITAENESITASLSERKPINALYTGIAYLPYQCTKNSVFSLEIVGPKKVRTCQWKLNGKKINGTEILLSNTGEQEILVAIIYEDNTTETIIRFMNVIAPTDN